MLRAALNPPFLIFLKYEYIHNIIPCGLTSVWIINTALLELNDNNHNRCEVSTYGENETETEAETTCYQPRMV